MRLAEHVIHVHPVHCWLAASTRWAVYAGRRLRSQEISQRSIARGIGHTLKLVHVSTETVYL